MIKYIFLVILFTFNAQAAVELKSTFEKVELKEFTSMKLNIMPDSGTQLIFPFKLDNEELSPRLKMRLSNDAGFWIPSTTDEIKVLKGQNTLTIIGLMGEGSGTPVHLGNLFISIGGYNISIALKTTYKPSEVISNIVFDLSDKDLSYMVEHQVKRRVSKLEEQYKEKNNALDRLAQQNALKHLAVMAISPHKNIKFMVEGNMEIGSNRLIVNADRMVIYGDTYFTLLFDIENNSNIDYRVEEYRIKTIIDENESLVTGKFNCNKSIRSDTSLRCAFVSTNAALKNAENYKLEIATDRGMGSFQW
jgi:hypothetical protein